MLKDGEAFTFNFPECSEGCGWTVWFFCFWCKRYREHVEKGKPLRAEEVLRKSDDKQSKV